MKMWAEKTLGELCSLITDGKHGDCRNEDDSGYYFISCKDVREGRIHYENSRQIVHGDFAETHRRTDLEPGDVLLTNSGTIGRLAIAPDDEKTQRTTFQKSVAILKPLPERITSHFLYYSLAASHARLINSAGGAAQKNLLLGELRRFTIRVPPLAEQAEIASILSAYDDLIENNRRRIQLLEQAARLLYREWFVHLRFPGHEHVTITDGVPEGWAEGVVADFYSTGSGGTPSRKNPDFYTGEIPWVKTQELTGGFILSTDERITDEAVKRSAAKLFPQHTVLIAMYGATIGQTAFLSVPSTTNQACCAVIPKKHGTSYVHAYLFFCHHKTDLVGLGQGAAQNNVSQQVIKSFKMVLPRKKLLEAFSEHVSPLFDQIEILQKNNINLTKARDLLLPRLMNGEVAV
jgi:type I restriction enzyme S subunit